MRFAIRPIVTLLFPAGASSLAFHPTFSNTLAIVSMTGIVSFADIGAGSIVQTYQVGQRTHFFLTSCIIFPSTFNTSLTLIPLNTCISLSCIMSFSTNPYPNNVLLHTPMIRPFYAGGNRGRCPDLCRPE